MYRLIMKNVESITSYRTELACILIILHIILIGHTFHSIFIAKKKRNYAKWLIGIIIVTNIYFRGCILSKIESKLLRNHFWYGPQTFLLFWVRNKKNKKMYIHLMTLFISGILLLVSIRFHLN